MEQKTGLVENLSKEQLKAQIYIVPFALQNQKQTKPIHTQPGELPSPNQTEQTETTSIFSEEKSWPQNVRQISGQVRRDCVLKTIF